ncbi:MAG: FAD-binding protein, partial [Bifidobacteriaceae bacterium]|nr:FAD-binding protein [Bifidobacteriaceae bacterium]
MSIRNRDNNKSRGQDISRRRFLLGSAAATAVGAGAVISGCAPSGGVSTGASSGNTSGGPGAASAGQCAELSFYTPPEPIADSAIDRTVEADFVVVGGGIGGLTAALSASDENASVIVLEKGKVSRTGGSDIAAIGSSVQAAN